MRGLAGALLLSLAAACGGSTGEGSTAPAAVEQPDEPISVQTGPDAPPAPAPATPPALVSPEEDEAALMTAARAYVAKNVAPGLQYTVALKAREGDFALLLVLPAAQEQDSALVFMRKDQGTWTGLDLGTGIECADHVGQGMPQSLCDAAGL
jgi:hypothetical protein